MKNTTEEWQLFVDESGDMTSTDRRSVVIGLAWREDDTREGRRILHDYVRKMLPMVPYPPHATLLHQPASWPAWRRCGSHPRGRGVLWAKRCDRALAIIDADDSSADVAAYRASLSEGTFPEYDLLRRVGYWLRGRDRRVCDGLALCGAEAQVAYRGLCRALAEFKEPDGCFVVTAAPSLKTDDEADEEDRYATLLEAVLERTASLLACREGPKRLVRLHVARRWHKDIDLAKFHQLSIPSLARIASASHKRSVGAYVPPALDAPFRFVIGNVWDANSDPSTHPGVVIADWLANRLGLAFKALPPLSGLERATRRVAALPLTTAMRSLPEMGPMPAAAADGPARAAVLSAYERGLHAEVSAIAPPWAREQAERWILAARALRSSGEGGAA
ncbi:MAG: hypothetical protein R6V85_13180 [Polyangia bacterium]